jgi:hypothetical protein
MDNFEEIKPEPVEREEADALWISEDVRSYIYEAAKWTKFLAIVGFVFTALIAISAFSAGAVLNSLAMLSPNNPLVKMGSAAITIIYLLIALLYFYPSFLLFRFSTAANQAVLYADQASLSAAMGKLKSFFKFWGILTIVLIIFYILAIVFAVTIAMSMKG